MTRSGVLTMLWMRTRDVVFVTLLLLCAVASSSVEAQWQEVKNAHYAILFQAGFEQDVAFTQTQLDRAEELMKRKYGVTPSHYYISFYLFPQPTQTADVNRAQNRCCTAGASGLQTGQIDYLALSSAAWMVPGLTTSLGLPKDENFHAKVMMSEYIPIGHYAVQDARASGGWKYYTAPEWFVQGLQEYDGIFHTTDVNRKVTAMRLLQWARNNPSTFKCCSPSVTIADAYNGGATFMTFLADQFGEDIHTRLLRNGASTFDAAFAEETKPYSSSELFARFQRWLRDSAARQPSSVVRMNQHRVVPRLRGGTPLSAARVPPLSLRKRSGAWKRPGSIRRQIAGRSRAPGDRAVRPGPIDRCPRSWM